MEGKRGNYDATQLSALYTANDAGAAKVIRELRDRVTSPDQMRAIGFCVSLQHARYMAELFNRAGIAAVAVTGTRAAPRRGQSRTDGPGLHRPTAP